jgi:hypothetical protein
MYTRWMGRYDIQRGELKVSKEIIYSEALTAI